MNDLLDTLRTRRSIRFFKETPVSEEQLKLLKEALLRSPTSRGRNPWQFILIDEREKMDAVSKAKMHGSGFIADANLAFVICADETVSDVWIEDCSIAAITLQYMAHSLGLGSCWAQIRLREHDDAMSAETYLQKLLEIPEHVRVTSVIGIGHPAEEKDGHSFATLPEGKFHFNRYVKRN
jgi:nitroreductase